MKSQLVGAPIPAIAVDVWRSRCSEPFSAGVPADGLVRTRAFAAVPTGALSGAEVCPARGVLGGTRPAGSERLTPMHVDLDPFRPRPGGGPS